MAASTVDFLPALEPCLKGEIILLSWQEAYEALRTTIFRTRRERIQSKKIDPPTGIEHTLCAYFNDDTTNRHLQNPFEPFPPPSQAAKDLFETRTSAINLADPGDNGPYDPKQIKDDAQWLSDVVKLDQSVALRIVVLEWQKRAASRLKSSTMEQNTSDSFATTSFFAKSTQFANSIRYAEKVDSRFDKKNSREARLLDLYLSERLHVLKCADLLVRYFQEYLIIDGLPDDPPGIFQVGYLLAKHICGCDFKTPQIDGCLHLFTSALQQRLNRMEAGSGWFEDDVDIELHRPWMQTQADETLIILQFLGSVLEEIHPSARATVTYFELMHKTAFLTFQSPLILPHTCELIAAFAPLVACHFLNSRVNQLNLLPPPINTQPKNVSFLSSESALQDLNQIMTAIIEASKFSTDPTFNLASIAVMSWLVLLDVYDHNDNDAIPDPFQLDFIEPSKMQALAVESVDRMAFFDVVDKLMTTLRQPLLDPALDNQFRDCIIYLINYSVHREFVLYDEPSLKAFLSTIGTNRSPWEDPHHRILDTFTPEKIIHTRLADWMELIVTRFPLEMPPFARLFNALLRMGTSASEAYETFHRWLDSIPYYTELLNPAFGGYDDADTTIDPIEGFYIELNEDLPLFVSQSAPQTHSSSLAMVLHDGPAWAPVSCLAVGARGEVLGDQERPLMVRWETDFQPLNHLVNWLSTAAPASSVVLFSTMNRPTQDEMIDILNLLTTLLQTYHLRMEFVADSGELAQQFLENRAPDFSDEPDLITIVFSIMESQLQQQRNQSGAEISTEILAKCVEFIYAASFFSPGRIWPLLARSRLLDINGSDPSLVAIVTNTEMIRGRYDFLLASIKLYRRLITLAYTRDITRPVQKQKSLTKLGVRSNAPTYIPGKTVKSIMTGYTRIMISVFENRQFWQFESREQQVQINETLMASFERILKVTYGFDEEGELQKKFSHVLADSSEVLTDLLLSNVESQSLAAALMSSLSNPFPDASTAFVSNIDYAEREIAAAMELATSVLRVAVHVRAEPSLLEKLLFQAAPLFGQMFASSPKLEAPVANLMDALLDATFRQEGSQNSLLGHMGSSTAKSFLVLLTRLNKPILSKEHQLVIWRLLSTVVSSKQQWFALYLLTGKAPREQSGSAVSNGCVGLAVFRYALDQLTYIFEGKNKSENIKVAIAMLGFVSKAYNYWPWAVSTLSMHPTFVKSLIDYLGALTPPADNDSIAWQSVMAASIAEILTMLIHTSRQTGDISTALTLVPKLGFLKNNAFKVPSYRYTLHKFLHTNLALIAPNCKMEMFKHTLVFPIEYGSNFYYDVGLAQAMLETPSNVAYGKVKIQKFDDDVEKANLDLTNVDIHIQLHKKAKLLFVELAQAFNKDDKVLLADPLLDVFRSCIEYIGDCGLPTEIVDELQESQTDLAATIMQKLATVSDSQTLNDIVDVFPMLWKSIKNQIPLSSDSLYMGPKAQHNRQLLRTLYLIMQPMQRFRNPTDANLGASTRGIKATRLRQDTYSLLLDILQLVIIDGFISLTELVHSAPSPHHPADFALLTGLFQSILAIPGAETIHSPIATALNESNVAAAALRLFSWSHHLDPDPLYGEHAILFLLALSSLPSFAESLAVVGCLSSLSSAHLMRLYVRPGGSGPFDSPYRAHAIWARGILPLTLNLLRDIGTPIAPEVVAFLSQYKEQIARLLDCLENVNAPVGTRPSDAHMTIGIAAETHSLCLLAKSVEVLRGQVGGAEIGILEGWDGGRMQEAVEEWCKERIARRNFLVGEMGKGVEERVWIELEGAKECLAWNP